MKNEFTAEKVLAAVAAATSLNARTSASAPHTGTAVHIPRISHLQLGPKLLAAKATDKQIFSAFSQSFANRGTVCLKPASDKAKSAECTCAACMYVAKRAAIYMHIAEVKAREFRNAKKAEATKKAESKKVNSASAPAPEKTSVPEITATVPAK
jgi:hypothetical protein